LNGISMRLHALILVGAKVWISAHLRRWNLWWQLHRVRSPHPLKTRVASCTH